MGHFEKGQYVEEPFENLESDYIEAVSHLHNGVKGMGDSMIEWNKHSGKFEKGREITVARSVERTLEQFATSLQNGLNRAFKDIITK